MARRRRRLRALTQQAKGVPLALPDWLDVDTEVFQARLTTLPGADAVPFPIEMAHVIEFYS